MGFFFKLYLEDNKKDVNVVVHDDRNPLGNALASFVLPLDIKPNDFPTQIELTDRKESEYVYANSSVEAKKFCKNDIYIIDEDGYQYNQIAVTNPKNRSVQKHQERSLSYDGINENQRQEFDSVPYVNPNIHEASCQNDQAVVFDYGNYVFQEMQRNQISNSISVVKQQEPDVTFVIDHVDEDDGNEDDVNEDNDIHSADKIWVDVSNIDQVMGPPDVEVNQSGIVSDAGRSSNDECTNTQITGIKKLAEKIAARGSSAVLESGVLSRFDDLTDGYTSGEPMVTVKPKAIPMLDDPVSSRVVQLERILNLPIESRKQFEAFDESLLVGFDESLQEITKTNSAILEEHQLTDSMRVREYFKEYLKLRPKQVNVIMCSVFTRGIVGEMNLGGRNDKINFKNTYVAKLIKEYAFDLSARSNDGENGETRETFDQELHRWFKTSRDYLNRVRKRRLKADNSAGKPLKKSTCRTRRAVEKPNSVNKYEAQRR